MNYFNLSETNGEPFYKPKNNGHKGGGLGDIFSNNYSSLLFNATKEDNYNVLLFLLNQKEITKINYQNENGSTILHLLVDKYQNPEAKNVIDNILSRSDYKDILDIQDNNGNTALHLSVINGHFDLCDKLVQMGANPLIKNNAGLFIESETETIIKNDGDFKITAPQKDTEGILIVSSDNSVFISKKALENKSENKDANIVQKIVNSVTSALNDSSESEKNPNPYYSSLNASEFISHLANTETKRSPAPNTSEILNKFIEKNNIELKKTQEGGKKIKKTRKLNTDTILKENSLELPKNTLSEPSLSDTDSDDKSSVTNELSELSRMINNQATEIHERSVKKISELLKISDQEARVIKAYIYNEVKNKHPELNNFDRAVEMEKRITKDYLESIDSNKIKELSDMISEKQKNKSENTSSVSESEEVKPKKTKSKKEKVVSDKPKKKSKQLLTTSTISDFSITSLS